MQSKGKTANARMWVYVGDQTHPYNVFNFTLDRGRDGPKRFLKDYNQVLLADAYGGYNGVVAGNQITRAGCWAHMKRLGRASLTPQDLLKPGTSLAARPILVELVTKALDHYRAGLRYLLALPRPMVRLRLACLWPILIGLETLLILIHNDHWLEPTKASKLRRIDVYKLVACSIPVVASNGLIRSWVEKLVVEIEASMTQ